MALKWTMKALKERFESKYIPEPNSGCWLWLGFINPKGYGITRVSLKKSIGAHKLSYRLYVGEVPKGLHLDHLCRNPCCVNPEHLEAVTPRENVLRSPIAKAAKWARRTHCGNGHEFSAENMVDLKTERRRRCKICANAAGRLRYATDPEYRKSKGVYSW